MSKPNEAPEAGIASMAGLREAEAIRQKKEQDLNKRLKESGSRKRAIVSIDPKDPVTLVDKPHTK